MYVILITFIFTSFVFLIFGNSFVQIIDRNKNKYYTLFDAFFIGLCLVGSLLNLWSVFFPTNHTAFLLLLLISIIITIFYKKEYTFYFKEFIKRSKDDKIQLLLIVSCVVVVLFFSVVPPKLYDSYLYHINSIQWNEKYKAVPGLANLHDRFGFNSSVFVLSSAFSFKFLYEQYIFVINSLAYLFFLIWIIKQTIHFKNITSIFLLLFIYYFTNQYYLDISSPGSDLMPNIFLSYLLINSIIFKDYLFKKQLLFITLSLFCVTLKLSTLPVLLLSILPFFLSKERFFLKFLYRYFSFGVLLVFPWLLRNIILSGYLLFPVPSIDLFDFDWKVPVENAQLTKDWIYSWGRIPFKDYKEVLDMPFSEWFNVWWKSTLPLNKRFLIFAMLSPILHLLVYTYIKKNEKQQLIPIFISILTMLLWLFTAPDIRFLFSVILFLSLSPLLLLNLSVNITNKFKSVIIYLCIFVTLFLLGKISFNLFKNEYNLNNISDYIYLAKDVSTIKEEKNIKFNTKVFNTRNYPIYLYEPNPAHSQCFDKFPCSCYIDENLKLRGDDLSDGFNCSK